MTPLLAHGIIVYKTDDITFVDVHTAFAICEIKKERGNKFETKR